MLLLNEQASGIAIHRTWIASAAAGGGGVGVFHCSDDVGSAVWPGKAKAAWRVRCLVVDADRSSIFCVGRCRSLTFFSGCQSRVRLSAPSYIYIYIVVLSVVYIFLKRCGDAVMRRGGRLGAPVVARVWTAADRRTRSRCRYGVGRSRIWRPAGATVEHQTEKRAAGRRPGSQMSGRSTSHAGNGWVRIVQFTEHYSLAQRFLTCVASIILGGVGDPTRTLFMFCSRVELSRLYRFLKWLHMRATLMKILLPVLGALIQILLSVCPH